MSWQKTKHPSVYVRHTNACPAREGGRCRCAPSYYAQARDKQTKKIVKSRVVHDINEAVGWLTDFRRGHLAGVGSKVTFGALVLEFIDAMEQGVTRPKRSTEEWSPKTIRGYRSGLNVYVTPGLLDGTRREAKGVDFTNAPAEDITAEDWQRLIDMLNRKGLSTNAISSILMPVRSVYRWACSPNRRKLTVNATQGLELPASDEVARTRIATPGEAAMLLGHLTDPRQRTLYALAFYSGMRCREIRPATWAWVEDGRIHVKESKSKSGIRHIPMAGTLRAILLEERMRQGNPPADQRIIPVDPAWLQRLAKRTWIAAGVGPIGLHDCRHTYASLMIAAMAAAGKFNAKTLSSYMGHSSIQITFDRYGHLFPGNEAEAADMLDAYLKGQTG
jgi:integrase